MWPLVKRAPGRISELGCNNVGPFKLAERLPEEIYGSDSTRVGPLRHSIDITRSYQRLASPRLNWVGRGHGVPVLGVDLIDGCNGSLGPQE